MKRIVFIALTSGLGALLMAAPTQTAKSATSHNAWPAENLSGKILAVDENGKLLIVEGADKIPFDIRVTPKTSVRSQNQKVAANDLSQYLNRNATVRMIPESRGDVAASIQIGS